MTSVLADALAVKLWSERMYEAVLKTPVFSAAPYVHTHVERKPLTKREWLAQIIGEHMGYDGDAEGAADAVMEFYDKLNSES